MKIRIQKKQNMKKCEALFERYSAEMYRVSYCVLKDPQLAEDAMQETFRCVITIADSFDPEAPETRAYLYIMAKNTAIDQYNKRKSVQNVTIPIDETVYMLTDENLTNEIEICEAIAGMRFGDQIEPYLEKLCELDQEILWLRYGRELSCDRIAGILNMSPPNVRQRITRLRKQLKERLTSEGGDEK